MAKEQDENFRYIVAVRLEDKNECVLLDAPIRMDSGYDFECGAR